jgi:hypothetical protein
MRLGGFLNKKTVPYKGTELIRGATRVGLSAHSSALYRALPARLVAGASGAESALSPPPAFTLRRLSEARRKLFPIMGTLVE